MLKNLGRLQKRSDFLRLNTAGQKWNARTMVVLAAPNDLSQKRFGITATKKLEKLATGRNRMKRRLRAVAADVLTLQGKDGMDYVLIARNPCATLPYEALIKDFRWCLEKLGCLDA